MTLDPEKIQKYMIENLKKNRRRFLIIKSDIDKFFENVLIESIAEDFNLSDSDVAKLKKIIKTKLENDEKFVKEILEKMKSGGFYSKDDFKYFVLKKLPEFYIEEVLHTIISIKKLIPSLRNVKLDKLIDSVKTTKKVYKRRAEIILNKSLLKLEESATFEDPMIVLTDVDADNASKFIAILFLILLSVNLILYVLELLTIKLLIKSENYSDYSKGSGLLKALISHPGYIKFLFGKVKEGLKKEGILPKIGSILLSLLLLSRIRYLIIIGHILFTFVVDRLKNSTNNKEV